MTRKKPMSSVSGAPPKKREKTSASAETPAIEPTTTAYKAFDKDFRCRGFQYEPGKTYQHSGPVVRCTNAGFHACDNPLDVLAHYNLIDSRFAVVTANGDVDRGSEGDTKFAAAEITIKAELTLSEFVRHAASWLLASIMPTTIKVDTSTTNATSGDDSQLAASGAASQLAASGADSKLAASGNASQLNITGRNGIIVSAGRWSRAKGADGTWIALAEFDDGGNCTGFATGCAGRDGVPADEWLVARGGKLVKV